MMKNDDIEESVLDELTSVKITKRTLKWIHRLKTIYERQTGRTFSLDGVIFNGISFCDWVYAREHGETTKDYHQYLEEVEKKIQEDRDTSIHGLYEEFEAWNKRIKFIDEEENK